MKHKPLVKNLYLPAASPFCGFVRFDSGDHELWLYCAFVYWYARWYIKQPAFSLPAVHITDIQKALFQPQNSLYIAKALDINASAREVTAQSEDGIQFKVRAVACDVLMYLLPSCGLASLGPALVVISGTAEKARQRRGTP